MDKKTVLYTVFRTGNSRGFGFRNYWAHPWPVILDDFGSDFDLFKKY
jgi:hypothetical protein